MRALRGLAVVITGVGLVAGVPSRDAQACDDDRYPCPVRAQPTQESAPAQPAASSQQKKKVSQPRANEKTNANREREVARPTARTKVSKSARQERPGDGNSQKATEPASPAALPAARAEQSFNSESGGESLVATAGTAWPASPIAEGAGATPGATGISAAEAAPNAVQLVEPNDANELDRVAAPTDESSWITYLLLMLAVTLGAASLLWFFSGRRFLLVGRAVNPR
jgi:hypothetical protein